MFDASVEIASAFESKIAAMVRALGEDALNEPLLAGGWIIANEAKRRAAYKTGTLRRDIRPEIVENGVVMVGTSVPYGRRIEFGFIGKDSRGRNYHQAARPFLRPAYDEKKGEAMAEVVEGLRDILAASR